MSLSQDLPNFVAEKQERRWKRFQVEIPVHVELLHNGSKALFHSTANDIGQGGLGLFIPRTVEIGMIVCIVLSLPYSRENLKIRAAIRNRRGFHYGLEFLDCTAAQRQILIQNCRALELLE